MRTKGQAIDKAKKQAVSDAIKRTFKNFGQVLGNCLSDKNYLKQISNIKQPPVYS